MKIFSKKRKEKMSQKVQSHFKNDKTKAEKLV